MALCPNCHEILKFWNIKAECPRCGVNIPNYDWEGRLNEDAENAKLAWVKFNRFTGNFKSSLFGSNLRIVRFIFTFMPLIALVLPLASYSITLPYYYSGDATFSLLSFTLNKLLKLNFGSLLSLTSSEFLGTPISLVFVAVVLLYLAVVFGVLNFLFVIIRAPALKATSNIVLCVLSDLCFIASGIIFTISTSQVANTTAAVLEGSVQFGLFVGIALFTLNIVLNISVNKTMKKQREAQAKEIL